MMFSNWLDIGEAAEHIDRVLEVLAVGGRRAADLAGRHIPALLLDDVDDVLGRQPDGVELLRIQPDPHGILADAEDVDIAHAGQARELADQVDGGVVAEIEAVVAPVLRGQRGDLQDRRRFLLHIDALGLDGIGQLGERDGDPVLHQHLGEVQIGADLEGDDQGIGAVAGAGGLHIDHMLHAVDLLLDGERHGVHHGGGAGAGIARRHRNGGRDDIGILGDGQLVERHAADEHEDDGQHIGQHRPLDEEFGDHALRSAAVTAECWPPAAGRSWLPGERPCVPEWHAGCRRSPRGRRPSSPLVISRRLPKSWPTSTTRCSTELSLSTTRR